MKANRKYIEALAGAISRTSKVKLEEGDSWHSDLKRKIITYNMTDLLNQEAMEAKGLILHEVSHINYTTDTPATELQKEFPKSMQALYNTYEDMRIENLTVNDFGDFAGQAFDNVHAIAGKKQVKNFESGLMSELNKIIIRQLTFEGYIESNNYDIQKELRHIYRSLEGGESEEESELEHKRIRSKAKAVQNTAELKKLVDDEVYPILKDLIKKEEKERESEYHNDKRGRGQTTEREGSTAELPSESEIKDLLSPYIDTVSHKLSDILKERLATRFEGAHLSGKLLSKNAYKVITEENRIFSRKNTPNKPNYVITLVLDQSGSMIEDGKHPATYTTAILLDEIAKKMGFKVNIIQYDSSVWIAPVSDYRTLKGGGNQDDDAMQKVKEITNPLDDNIVFILTDGGVCQDPRKTLEELYKKNYIIQAVGVGLNKNDSSMLREYYKNTVEAPKVELLPNILLNQLSRLIHR